MPTSSSARDRLQARLVAGLLALLVGVLAYGISCMLVPPAAKASGFGEDWQAMSGNPFALLGRLPHRLLGPLLAWLLGLGGEHYVEFTRGLTVLMLATLFLFCQKRGSCLVDAALVTLAIAITAPVQMYKLHWVGYTDPLCYALFLVMAMVVRHTAVFWSLFLLNMLNHELAIFFVPWLWFLRRQAGGAWRADLLWLVGAIAVYAAFYLYVKASAPQQLYNFAFFRDNPLFPGGTFAVWVLAIVQWTVAYGPVLAVLAWHQRLVGHGRERQELWLVLAGIAVVFCIAFDWQRHTNLILMPLAIASLRFLAAGHRLVYVGLLASAVLLFWWIPPWAPVSWPTHTLVAPAVATGVLIEGENGLAFGPLSNAVFRWLPSVLPQVLAIGVCLAAILLAGCWFARRDRAVADPTTSLPLQTP